MLLLETPSGGRIDHDEGDFVGGVRCFRLTLFVEHFLCISTLMCKFLWKSRIRDLVWEYGIGGGKEGERGGEIYP